jgi:hypothetical protein
MKIAVCFSGILRGNHIQNIETFKQKLPNADFFYTTWSGGETADYIDRYYSQPQLHYKPATEPDYPHTYKRFLRGSANNWQERSKQILAHCLVVDDYCKDYDVIIRARYDAILAPYLDLQEYCNMTYEKNQSIGFFTPRNMSLPQSLTNVTEGERWFEHHVDHLIIHKKNLLHTDLAWHLHQEKKLRIAEYGWWQVLSEPNGNNHLTFKGGVKLEKL